MCLHWWGYDAGMGGWGILVLWPDLKLACLRREVGLQTTLFSSRGLGTDIVQCTIAIGTRKSAPNAMQTLFMSCCTKTPYVSLLGTDICTSKHVVGSISVLRRL